MDPGKVFFDPNTLSKDGTTSLAAWSVSEDGKYFAYGLTEAGSDWMEWHIREVATGKDLPEILKYIKFFAVSWTPDGKGFFYSRFPASDEKNKLQALSIDQAIYYHRVGTPQASDELIYNRPDDKYLRVVGQVTEDGHWLVIYVIKGGSPNRMVYVKDLSHKEATIQPLIDSMDAFYALIGNDGGTFYLKTDKHAPRGKVVAVDAATKNSRDIIPEAAESLYGVSLVNDQFLANYAKDAHTVVRVYNLKGKYLHDVALPGIGTAGGFGGRRHDTVVSYGFSNYTTPNTQYLYDLKTGKSTVFSRPKIDFDPSAYTVEQVFYTSHDGTRVPMFIAHKKGVQLDGSNPTILTAYGGFGDVSQRPFFEPMIQVWMDMGGVYAAPNIRGGGEYGEEWHRAGMREKKQNVFDDFIAAAEWLIANKYTRRDKLGIIGTSNGGLLIGAVLNQRPDLFGAAVAEVGVMDMLRFNKFTVGKSWVPEYGSPDEPADFKFIRVYSPLHNIQPGTKYPAVLVTTADHDDRVVPMHSFKYTAALQAAQSGDKPILIRVETNSGHGSSSTTKQIDETADKLSFLAKELDALARVR